MRLGETESETNHQVALQRQVYSDLQEQITLDISEAIEQYQAMIGMNKVIILTTCHYLMSPRDGKTTNGLTLFTIRSLCLHFPCYLCFIYVT